jgi:hypothetical protein
VLVCICCLCLYINVSLGYNRLCLNKSHISYYNFLQNTSFLLLYPTYRSLYCNDTCLCTIYVNHKSSWLHGTLCISDVLSDNGIWQNFVLRLYWKKTDLIFLNNFTQPGLYFTWWFKWVWKFIQLSMWQSQECYKKLLCYR